MVQFDKGPPSALATLFMQHPDYSAVKELFWYDWGPVFYRGRLDKTAKYFVLPRYGYDTLMNNWTSVKEKIKVGGQNYHLHLKQDTADPAVGKIKLREAIKKLRGGLKNLPSLAKQLNNPANKSLSIINADTHPQWFLVLDHNDEAHGQKSRLRGKLSAKRTLAKASDIKLEKMELDSITVADDSNFLKNIGNQMNLPQYLKDGLQQMYK